MPAATEIGMPSETNQASRGSRNRREHDHHQDEPLQAVREHQVHPPLEENGRSRSTPATTRRAGNTGAPAARSARTSSTIRSVSSSPVRKTLTSTAGFPSKRVLRSTSSKPSTTLAIWPSVITRAVRPRDHGDLFEFGRRVAPGLRADQHFAGTGAHRACGQIERRRPHRAGDRLEGQAVRAQRFLADLDADLIFAHAGDGDLADRGGTVEESVEETEPSSASRFRPHPPGACKSAGHRAPSPRIFAAWLRRCPH